MPIHHDQTTAAKMTAAGGIHVYNSSALGLVVSAHEHNRVMGELERENAKLHTAFNEGVVRTLELERELAAERTQREEVAKLYAAETKRHNETAVCAEGYRRDLEFAAAKLEKAGLLND